MDQVSAMPQDAIGAINDQLLFSKKLQQLTNKIHATSDIDEIMLDLSQEICELFASDRLTIYVVSEDKTTIRSKLKTGMTSFKDFSLPIAESSIAGYVALFKHAVNVHNVYDEAELNSYRPRLQFIDKVDKRTGYTTRENFATPIVNLDTGELLGVLQLINNRNGGPFSSQVEEGVLQLCATLAVAFAQRLAPPVVIKSKYDPLVAHAILSAAELGLASRSARRKGLDVEDVLIDEFQVRRADIGASLSQFYGVPYEPYNERRARPEDALFYFHRAEIEASYWVPIEENEEAQQLVVLTTDPDRLMASGLVETFFPGTTIYYRVTTNLEFRQTIAQLVNVTGDAPAEEKGAWSFDSMPLCEAAEKELAARVNSAIVGAFRNEDTADIGITLQPRPEKTITRFRKDGSIESVSGSTVVDYRIDFPADDAS